MQNLNSKHPIFVSGLLGTAGGIVGMIIAALLSIPLGIILGDGSDTGEVLGYLIGMYCLVMFPVGSSLLGGIPGVILGITRNIQGKDLKLLHPVLAGFLSVVILSLGALTAMYVIPYPN